MSPATDTRPQNMVALEKANRMRLARAARLRWVHEPDHEQSKRRAARLILDPPEELRSLAVFELLRRVRNLSRHNARRYLFRAGPINEQRRLDELTKRQRRVLARTLAGMGR